MKIATTQPKALLIVEKGDGELWGRVTIKGNLIVDSAKNLESLKKKIKSLALDFENVEINDFEVNYDLTSFFEQYPFLNVSEIAKKAGISPAMMLHYTSGTKFPSEERVKQIESAIKEIGKELTKVKLHKAQKQPA
jgi:predicted DNA-binding transcriptional regulator AlpA